MAVIAALGLAAGIGGSIAASEKSKQAAKEVEGQTSIINKQKQANEALFSKQYYQDITERTDVLQMLRKMQEQHEEAQKHNEAIAAVTGQTEDSKIAAQDRLNKARADAIAQIATNASQLKDNYLKDWQTRLNSFYGQQLNQSDKLAGLYNNQANNWSNMASNAYNAAFNMLGSIDQKALKGK